MSSPGSLFLFPSQPAETSEKQTPTIDLRPTPPPPDKQPLLSKPPRRPRHGFELAGPSIFSLLVKDFFTLPQLLCLGGLVFGGLSYVPIHGVRVTLLSLAGVGLVAPLWRDVLASLGVIGNPWRENVTVGRTFAKLNEDMGPREYCVLNIGARYNGPFGFWNKNLRPINKQFLNLLKELVKKNEYGLLGGELEFLVTGPTRNLLYTRLYFNEASDVQRFAKDKLHALYWKSYYDNPAAENIEVYHELATVKSGASDNLYVNATAHGMGRLFERVLDDEGNPTGEWTSIRRMVEKKSESSKKRMQMDE
ncbi:hypothetical protein T439DRAFT_384613 [Meredithblackwellia eburnea MCA 4105]